MPLFSTQSMFEQLNVESKYLKALLLQTAEAWSTFPQSANAVVGLVQRLRAALDNVLIPCQGNSDLPAYAAAQFREPTFDLTSLLAGARLLVEGIIAEAKNIVPVNEDGIILKDTWNADGSVSVLVLQPAEMVTICGLLQTLSAAIPQ